MTFTLAMVMAVIGLHWFGDFVCQSDWMAKNKATSNEALGLHVLAYSAMCLLPLAIALGMGVFWLLLNGILHFVTDYFTSRVTKKLWEAGDVHNFFVVVGIDQCIHYLCLFGTVWLVS